VKSSSVYSFYEKTVDRESAYEVLKARAEQTATEAKADEGFDWGGILGGDKKKSSGSRSDGVLEAAAKSAARAIGSQLGRQIIRGVLGSILGGRK
jgi:hypothetical protein